ncbi:6017_t:CDS:2 [Diversispora eburnea]|uniref:6017_t:CDS:1 n=1 Tax=Diversispora eburnea TaxID=1213867 RepID=A0A9N8VGA5_9GLOM|nr:6017_t:CDS:2 [Diversispora eburnea]
MNLGNNSNTTRSSTPSTSFDAPSTPTSRTSSPSPSSSSNLSLSNQNRAFKKLAEQLCAIFYEGNQNGQEDSEVEKSIVNHIHKSHFEPVQIYEWLSKNRDTLQFQSLLGYFFGHEIGVEADKRKAYTFFLNAAKKNDHLAQYFVGASYLEGSGAKQDYELAFLWFQKSANGGCTNGLCALGYCYLNGYGVHKDELKELAEYWEERYQASLVYVTAPGDLFKSRLSLPIINLFHAYQPPPIADKARIVTPVGERSVKGPILKCLVNRSLG